MAEPCVFLTVESDNIRCLICKSSTVIIEKMRKFYYSIKTID